MAYKRVILGSAQREREEIIAYLTAVSGGQHAASVFLGNMDKIVDLICEFPAMHAVSRMPELAEKGYRVAYVGSYALLYTVADEIVFIEHVFHQRQDYAHLV